MNTASHPIWSLLRLMIYMIAMFIMASGVEGGTQIIRGMNK